MSRHKLVNIDSAENAVTPLEDYWQGNPRTCLQLATNFDELLLCKHQETTGHTLEKSYQNLCVL